MGSVCIALIQQGKYPCPSTQMKQVLSEPTTDRSVIPGNVVDRCGVLCPSASSFAATVDPGCDSSSVETALCVLGRRREGACIVSRRMLGARTGASGQGLGLGLQFCLPRCDAVPRCRKDAVPPLRCFEENPSATCAEIQVS